MQPDSTNPWVSGAEAAAALGISASLLANWRVRYADFPSTQRNDRGQYEYNLPQLRQWHRNRNDMQGSKALGELRLWNLTNKWRGDVPAYDMYQVLLAGMVEQKLHRNEGRVHPHTRSVESIVTSARQRYPEQMAALKELHILDQMTVEDALAAADSLVGRYGREGAESTTSSTLAALVQSLIGRTKADTIFDPACGTGGMLISIAQQLRARATGWDLNHEALDAARARAFLQDIVDHIDRVDSLAASAMDTFPVVVCDPPYGLRRPDITTAPRWAMTDTVRAVEWLWPQLVAASLDSTGEGYCVLPLAALSRNDGTEARRELVRRGALEAVLALPGLATATRIPLAVLVLRAPDSRINEPILMIDYSQKGRFSKETDSSDIADVSAALTSFRAGQPVELPYTTEVSPLELLDQRASLSPVEYVAAAARNRGHVADLGKFIEQVSERIADMDPLAMEFGAEPFTVDLEHVSIGQLIAEGRAKVLRGRRVESSLVVSIDDFTEEPEAYLPVITVGAMRSGGSFKIESAVKRDDLPPNTQMTQPGDVVMTGIGNVVAKVDRIGGHVVPAPLVVLRLESDIEPELVAGALSSGSTTGLFAGSTVHNDFRAVSVPVVTPERAAPFTRLLGEFRWLEESLLQVLDQVEDFRTVAYDHLASASAITSSFERDGV